MRSTSPPKVNPYHDQGRLHALQVMLCARSDELLAELGVGLTRSKKMFSGCCPVHGGDNHGALNLYHDGDTRPGFWRCHTKGCQNHFKKTIVGFVRGVLSHNTHAWGAPGDKEVSWKAAVDWSCGFLGVKLADVEVDYDAIEKRAWAAGVNALNGRPPEKLEGVGRADVRRTLEIPSSYFVKRGWSPEVLDRYDVGFYPHLVDEQGRHRPLANRVAVPVYDHDYRRAIGFTGRSIFDRCGHCSRHHAPEENCPDRKDRSAWSRSSKWYNHNFNRDSHLFNFWFAKKVIRETGVAVLVEGPGECLRLEESGVHNSLGLFGVTMSDEHQILLERSGAMHVVVLTNMDAAGDSARQELKKRLGRSFRLHFPLLRTNDLGEMRPQEVREEILPLVKKLSKGF